MWKFVVTFCAAILVVGAAPQGAPQAAQPVDSEHVTPVPILRYTESVGQDGSFNFSYEAGNGINVEGAGFTKRAQVPRIDPETGAESGFEEQDVLVQTGSYSYTAPDGTPIHVQYIADENGFQPVGDHLPQPPPLPDAIANSLSQQAAQQQQAKQLAPPQDAPVQQQPEPAPSNIERVHAFPQQFAPFQIIV
ncbi:endocuticle structural glycoprotein SgAbd-2-like [Phlebotomus argentipes]|uniref:endocuticle structural glycoprotein SgAbd-2-like n=1 Tax=Phlebotomus argentipes TaxID=94469 RepID=UPI0028930D2E|nr:endocuticle structural glycoprotein SgAbd-2-like [Phlebotomus argentipes]